MKNEDFDAFLINVVENDKKNIGYGDNFDAMCSRLTGHQKSVSSQKKMINYAVLPILMMVIALNIFFLFSQNNPAPQTMDSFTEENLINSSTSYFSEVLLSVND